MVFACDMDGVVTNFPKRFSNLLNTIDSRCPIIQDNNCPSWDWKEWYAPELKRIEVAMAIEEAWGIIKNSSGFWNTMEPLFPETMELLAARAKQQPIIFITRRDGYDPWGDTTSWLRAHGIESPLVYVVGSGEEKGDICKTLGIDIIIDDSPKYADEILSHGHYLIMPSWKYNEKYRQDNKYNYFRKFHIVNTLEEALLRAEHISATKRRK